MAGETTQHIKQGPISQALPAWVGGVPAPRTAHRREQSLDTFAAVAGQSPAGKSRSQETLSLERPSTPGMEERQ